MPSERLRDIEWRIRARIVSPIVTKIQENFWGLVWLFLNDRPANSIEELENIFSWKKIAIVWNSPALGNTRLWKKIDSYDVVIRFNRWILKEFLDVENTWKKIDFWTVWALDSLTLPSIRKQVKSIQDKVEIIVPLPYLSPGQNKKNLNIAMLECLSPYSNLSKFYIDDYIYKAACLQIWSEPSSGFLIIMHILTQTTPKEIWLYWFSFSSHNRIAGESYSLQHNFTKEEEIVRWWVKQRKRLELFE